MRLLGILFAQVAFLDKLGQKITRTVVLTKVSALTDHVENRLKHDFLFELVEN